MQISGFAVDMVERERVERMFLRNPKRLIEFVCSDLEKLEIDKLQGSAIITYLTKRIAVKEAYFKALGTGIQSLRDWQKVWVEHDNLGAPLLKNTHNRKGLISITDTKTTACAVVILEKDTE